MTEPTEGRVQSECRGCEGGWGLADNAHTRDERCLFRSDQSGRTPSPEPVGDQSLPCLAKGETEVDGAVLPVACDLWLNHDRTHWDERVFTFWGPK